MFFFFFDTYILNIKSNDFVKFVGAMSRIAPMITLSLGNHDALQIVENHVPAGGKKQPLKPECIFVL